MSERVSGALEEPALGTKDILSPSQGHSITPPTTRLKSLSFNLPGFAKGRVRSSGALEGSQCVVWLLRLLCCLDTALVFPRNAQGVDRGEEV